MAFIGVCFWLTGLFDADHVANGFPAMVTLLDGMMLPDFSRWR